MEWMSKPREEEEGDAVPRIPKRPKPTEEPLWGIANTVPRSQVLAIVQKNGRELIDFSLTSYGAVFFLPD